MHCVYIVCCVHMLCMQCSGYLWIRGTLRNTSKFLLERIETNVIFLKKCWIKVGWLKSKFFKYSIQVSLLKLNFLNFDCFPLVPTATCRGPWSCRWTVAPERRRPDRSLFSLENKQKLSPVQNSNTSLFAQMVRIKSADISKNIFQDVGGFADLRLQYS